MEKAVRKAKAIGFVFKLAPWPVVSVLAYPALLEMGQSGYGRPLLRDWLHTAAARRPTVSPPLPDIALLFRGGDIPERDTMRAVYSVIVLAANIVPLLHLSLQLHFGLAGSELSHLRLIFCHLAFLLMSLALTAS
jgi:hypothetical protein